MTERVELRLSDEYQHKLGELVAEYRTTTSDAVRRAIDEAYEVLVQRRRLGALERILAFEGVEDVPEPDELKRQIEEAYTKAIEDSLRRCESDPEPASPD